MVVNFLKDIIRFISFGPILGDQGVLGDHLGWCHRFSTQWMDASESNHQSSSFNELGGGFSRFDYSEGVYTHCRALDTGMSGMILQRDIVAGQSTLPDRTLKTVALNQLPFLSISLNY